MKKLFALFLAFCLAVGCGVCRAEEEETVIVASFYPVYILAKNVLQDVPGVRLACMAAPSTGCLHDYQLLTSDMRALSSAAALLINGAGMEGFLPMIREQLPDLPIVDCGAGVALLEEEDHHSDEDGHGEEGNPHIWLSPVNAIQMVQNMADGLSALLPEAAGIIQRNANDYEARLSALDAELAAVIAALPGRDIVTFHEAFPYFAARYGLNVAAVVAIEPEEPLSPRMLTNVIERVRAAGNPPLFAEAQYDSAALRIISQETGAPLYALNALTSGPDALTAYEDGMRENLAALTEALGNERP